MDIYLRPNQWRIQELKKDGRQGFRDVVKLGQFRGISKIKYLAKNWEEGMEYFGSKIVRLFLSDFQPISLK